jgi:hypothetical protein
VRVVEHQRGGLNADANELAAEDLRGEQAVRAEADQAAAGDRPLRLDRLAVFGWWQRARAAETAPVAAFLSSSLSVTRVS